MWLRLTWQKKNILQKESPGRVLQERCAKIFGKTYRKTREHEPFSKNISGCWPPIFFWKQPHAKVFFCDVFKTYQNSFFYSIVDPSIAASDLNEYLETLTITEDQRKSLKTLAITVDFRENIWNFGVAMKLSENRI